ncbi:MAG: META domain-containing protein [Spirochaetaceae bacterium]|jgi:hypothetical protein|nr:META domain-containing protein [Spirochaetaceae bacterium]
MTGCFTHKYINFFVPLLPVFIFWGCVALPSTAAPVKRIVTEAQPEVQESNFGEILNILWELREIRINYGITELDRAAMAENGMGDVFIIQFTEEGINGKAAPNRYFSSFELLHEHDFRLRPIVSTLMAADINIGGLMENEYYWYLQRVSRWNIVNGGLELYAYPEPDNEITLRYTRQDYN